MNTRSLVSLTIYLLATSSLFAQERGGQRPEINSQLRQVIDDCHTSLNIARPERPTDRKERGREPNAEEIAKMNQMDANREKIRACVESKGYHMPELGGHHGPHGRPPQDNGGSSGGDSSSLSSEASSTAQ